MPDASPGTAAPTVVAHFRFRPAPEAEVLDVPIKAPLFQFWQAAREWDSRMRNRNRWIGDDGLYDDVAELTRQRLGEWGAGEDTLSKLARGGIVEVVEGTVLPEETGPAEAPKPGGFLSSLISTALKTALTVAANALRGQLRRMPWENLLVMAGKKYQNHERSLVYRRVAAARGPKHEFEPEELKAVFVESAPGALWNLYDFDLEHKAFETAVKGMPVKRQQNRTLKELAEWMRTNSPAVIHFSGIDGYQGLSIVGGPADGTEEKPAPKDGVYFRDDSGKPKVETPEAVAAALCSGEPKPLLVTFNLYNSSARLAAETVSRGAAAAIGFQDFLDDTAAEIFFVNLYRAWSEADFTPLSKAFEMAVRELDPYLDRIRGFGLTLWTSEPLLDNPGAIVWPVLKKEGSEGKGTGGAPPVELAFDIETYPSLNYSVLHNGKRKMFETFRIYRFGGGERTDVRVEIKLNVGGLNFPFRESYSMRHHILDLTDKIAIGLTSALSRSLRESVRTTIFVRITVGANDERFCRTFDVSLLAVDEWIDDSQSGVFLPSFVLPRDPTIAGIIAKAQGYLMAIADDAAQGFDGYQSCEEAEDPAAALEPQTRAIWYALQHDFAIKYINPPPTFTASSQRLRTPSETLKGGRGTCIDLALLLAACYEHIGLYPVVFLLAGHAFAGYWADEERRKKFRTTKYDPHDPFTTVREDQFLSLLEKSSPEEIVTESALAPVEWRYDARRRAEIQLAVQNGELVAVEATYLTNSGSFASACEVGESNLDESEGFDSMLDVSLARDNGVTPLPLAVEEGS